MARTPSNMVPLGTKAPDFNLLNVVSGTNLSLDETKGNKGTLIMFICNHCPFVKYINNQLVELSKEFLIKGIHFVAISSNDVEKYPQDSPELMLEVAKEEKYIFPYLYDETQEVAKLYDAACTPDFFLYDSELSLVYRGQLDDSRPGNDIEITGNDLKNAINNLLENNPPLEIQKPSIGCNIKWKE